VSSAEELEIYDEGLAKGRAEGLAKRLAEEEAQGEEKMVLTAYQNKFSIEQIRTFSNLSEDRILEILKRNKLL
jgi:hypothetical protein